MISLFLSLSSFQSRVCVRAPCCSLSRVGVVLRVLVRFLSHVMEDKMPKKCFLLFFFKTTFHILIIKHLFTQKGVCSIHLRF